MYKRAFSVCLLAVVLLFLTTNATAQDGKMPWDDPNSGFEGIGGPYSPKPGTDKIEKVVNTSGGTKDDGTVVSSAGNEAQQGFVNDFLDQAGEKIKNAGGGSGWVWTWEKKWKVDANGNPVEVVEDWQRGDVGVKTEPVKKPEPAAPSAPSPTPGSSANQTAATAPSPSGTPTSPTSTPATSPAPKTATTPTKSPSTGGTPTTAKTPPATPKAGGDTSGPSVSSADNPPATPQTPGVDPAPTLLPKAEVRLVIQNPITFEEEAFPNNVYPTVKNPPLQTRHDKLTKAVPEDTRVRIGLELSDQVNPEDVTLTITDSDGQQPPVAPELYPSYRHMFRIPDDNRYSARVLYKHPDSDDPTPKEIIRVIIPVHRMDFDSRTIDANQERAATAGDRRAGTTGTISAVYSRGSGLTNTGDYSDSSQTDLSDLYTDPNNPPPVSDGGIIVSQGAGAGAGAGAYGNETEAGYYQGRAGQNTEHAGSGAGSGYADRTSVSRDKDAWSSRAQGRSGTADRTQYAAFADDGRQRAGTGGRASGGGGSSASGRAYSGNQSGLGNSSQRSATGASGQQQYSDVGGESGSYASSGGDSGASSGGAASGNSSTAYGAADYVDHTGGGVTTGSAQGAANDPGQVAESAYLIGLSMKNEANQKVQSFNFTSDPYPTADQIKRSSQVSFSIYATSNVLRDSVNIVIFDGQNKRELPLTQGGEAFVQNFANPTAEAYIWIYGDTSSDRFSYKLSIPVAE